jgi:hypothetical protein
MPLRIYVPEGRDCEVHVAPEFVVAKMSPDNEPEPLLYPTA